MTADAVERIIRSLLKQHGLSFVVRQVSVDSDEWTVVLSARGSITRIKGPLGSPYTVRTALMKALSLEV
jgi:hypothetical protein